MEEPEYRAMFDVEETHWWFVARREFLRELLVHLPSKSLRIADIGAGTGGMTGFLRQYGTVIGIEPNKAGRMLAKRRGIILRSGDAQRTGIPSKSVDVVCFFDVLYHRGIHDTHALMEAKRMLRPGGWLVITDCALPFLTGPHDRAVAGRERYTLAGLCTKVTSTGFLIEKKTYMYFCIFPVVIIKRLIDRFAVQTNGHRSDVKPVNVWINALCTMLSRIEAKGLAYVSYPWGSSLFILARIPGGKR